MELGHSSAHKHSRFQIRPSTFVILVEAFDAFRELNAATVSGKAQFDCCLCIFFPFILHQCVCWCVCVHHDCTCDAEVM